MSINVGSIEERMPGNKCPHCGRSATGGTSAAIGKAPPTKPKPGDFALCLYCGALNRYGEDLALRPTVEAERQELMRDPRLREILPVMEKLAAKYRRGKWQ